MKNNYFRHCMIILLLLIFGVKSSAQIVANDDMIKVVLQESNIYSVIVNDSLNGLPLQSGDFFVEQISSTLTIIDLLSDGTLDIPNLGITPPGFFFINYRVCETENPTNCAEAVATLYITACGDQNFLPNIVSVNQPSCENPEEGSILLDLMPSTINWTISISNNGAFVEEIEGVGISTTVNLPTGVNTISISDPSGCPPLILTTYIGLSNEVAVSMESQYVDFNNDGFTNVGDIISYQITVTNNSCVPITDITLLNENLIIEGETIPSLEPGISDNTTFSAISIITQQDINAGLIFDWMAVFAYASGVEIANDFGISTQLNLNDGIKFNAFIDLNGNNIQDVNEVNAAMGTFQYQINDEDPIEIHSSNGMFYLYETNPDNNYNISYSIGDDNQGFETIISNYSDVSIAENSGITIYNFPIIITPYLDDSVNVLPYGATPRPGFNYSNRIVVKNLGNQTIPTGTLTFNHNPIVSIESISVSGTESIENGFTYTYSNLEPGESLYVVVTMLVPTIPTVNLGDLITNSATISGVSEGNQDNNLSSLTQTIVGSYDPNDKTEHHSDKIVHSTFSSNDYLTYTIRFENTGTAEAINVKIEDTLDEKLDTATLKMVSSSHNYILVQEDDFLTWKFDAINLPPSEPNSFVGHGYITYEIKPNSGYAIGDIIENTAAIIFDFNPAIITNTTSTEFVNTLSLNQDNLNELLFYPNPVKNDLHIKNNTIIDEIEINNIVGQKVFFVKVNQTETTINFSTMSNGIYFIKIKEATNFRTIKIIKDN